MYNKSNVVSLIDKWPLERTTEGIIHQVSAVLKTDAKPRIVIDMTKGFIFIEELVNTDDEKYINNGSIYGYIRNLEIEELETEKDISELSALNKICAEISRESLVPHSLIINPASQFYKKLDYPKKARMILGIPRFFCVDIPDNIFLVCASENMDDPMNEIKSCYKGYINA